MGVLWHRLTLKVEGDAAARLQEDMRQWGLDMDKSPASPGQPEKGDGAEAAAGIWRFQQGMMHQPTNRLTGSA